jgi:hypothetical protein
MGPAVANRRDDIQVAAAEQVFSPGYGNQVASAAPVLDDFRPDAQAFKVAADIVDHVHGIARRVFAPDPYQL